MRKGWKKEKEKGFLCRWAGGIFGPARRSARARGRRPSCGPRRGDSAGARGADAVAAGPHVSESGGGKTASRFDGAGKPAARGGRIPAASGLGGDSPTVARFLDNGEVP
jgi:hypothetical protein